MQFPGTSGLSLVYSQRQRSLFQSYGSQEEFKRTTHTNIFSKIFPTSFLWFAFFLHPVGKTCSSNWESFFRTFGRSKKKWFETIYLVHFFQESQPLLASFQLVQQPFFCGITGFFRDSTSPQKNPCVQNQVSDASIASHSSFPTNHLNLQSFQSENGGKGPSPIAV